MNENPVVLEARVPIWAGNGSLYGIQALSPVSDEDAVFHVFSNVFSDILPTSKYEAQGLVIETKPREVVRGLPDPQSQMGLGGDKKW